MVQSTSHEFKRGGLHVAIIMDGYGRWAASHGLPRAAGHRAGADAVRRTIRAALRLRIDTLTLFAFTSGNWERPRQEVAALMELFRDFFCAQKVPCVAQGIRVSVVGRRDRLKSDLRAAVDDIESATAGGQFMHLRIAVDYSARDAILRAASQLNTQSQISAERFTRVLAEVSHAGGVVPDVDLLIRTGGEQRLSDCLLWESAYAELVFLPQMWPDFDATNLDTALRAFHERHRRFGRLPETVAPQEAIEERDEQPENAALLIL